MSTQFGMNVDNRSYVQFTFASGWTVSVVNERDGFNCLAWHSGTRDQYVMKFPDKTGRNCDGVKAAAFVARVARWKAPL